MNEEIKSTIDKMENEIKKLKTRVEKLEAKEAFDGNLIFQEPIKNRYNR
jgi:septation ring formation regulator EzrA